MSRDSVLLAGQNPGHEILVKPALVTQSQLRADDINTVAELEAKVPAFATSSAATAPWIPAAAH